MKLKRFISAVVSAAITLTSISMGMVMEVSAAVDEVLLFEGEEHIDGWNVVAGNPDVSLDIPTTLTGDEFSEYENLSITFCFNQAEIDNVYGSGENWKAEKTIEIMIKANDKYSAGAWSWLAVTDDDYKCGYNGYSTTLTAGEEHTIKFPTASIIESLNKKSPGFDLKTMSNAVILKIGWPIGATVKRVAFTDPSTTYSYQELPGFASWGVFPGSWDLSKTNDKTKLIINYTASNVTGWPGFEFLDKDDQTKKYATGGFSEGTNKEVAVKFSDMIANGFATGKNLRLNYWQDEGTTITINSFKIKNEELLGFCYTPPVAVSSVSITDSATAFVFKKGTDGLTPATAQFVATVLPNNADDKTVTWSSSDETVATVDKDGKVTPLAIGTTTITATSVSDSTKTATRTVNIVEAAAESISINETEALEFMLGSNGFDVASKTLTATVTPANAVSKTVVWESADTTIATVSAAGVVTPLKSGTTTIKAKVSGTDIVATKTVNIIPVALTGITIGASSLNANGLDVITVGKTITPDNAYDKTLVWVSSDTTIATVNATGTVTFANPTVEKTVSINAKQGSVNSNTLTFTVTPIVIEHHVTGVTVSDSTASIVVGDTKQLSATVAPDNASVKTVLWTSSNNEIATVSDSGLITAVGVGTATITAKTVDGDYTATCAVTVTPVKVTGVTLTDETASAVFGTTKQLNATVAPNNASDKSVTWTSSNTSIATVDANGLVTAVAEGTAVITVKTKDGNFTDTCEFTVTVNHVTSITVSDETAELEIGKTKQLSAVISPDNATNKAFTWSSSNAEIATVDSNGLVSAIAIGTATITAKTADGAKSDICAVTVTEIKPTAVSILVDGTAPAKDEISLAEGKTKTISVTVTPAEAAQKAELNSENEAIATVNDGVLTAVSVGETKITAKTGAVSKTITVKVTEKPKFPYTIDEGIVLFEGEGKASAWGQAVTCHTIKNDNGIVDPAALTSTSAIKVYYSGDSVPELVFQSWSGGEGWAKIAATATETGIAYYSYADCIAAYKSDDLSKLDAIHAGATASELTVTKVVVMPTYPTDNGGTGAGGTGAGGSGTGGSSGGSSNTGNGGSINNGDPNTTEKTVEQKAEEASKAVEDASEEVINGEKTKVVKATIDVATETIAAALESKTEGEKIRVSIDMSESKTIGKDVINAIKGSDASIELKMTTEDGTEYSWVIDGSTVDENFDMDNLDMSIKVNETKIPEETVAELESTIKSFAGDDVEIIPLTLNHNGAFGFSPVLNVGVGAEMAGKAVVLTYYNPETGEMEIMGEPAIVDESGNVSVKFYHASEYLLAVVDPKIAEAYLTVIATPEEHEPTDDVAVVEEDEIVESDEEDTSDKPSDTVEADTDVISEEEPEPVATTEETDKAIDNDENAETDDKSTNPNTGVLLAFIPAVIAGAVTFGSKKRRK